MHIGNNNHYTKYTNFKLSKVSHVDLGVTVSKDLKPRKHCSDVVKTANKQIDCIGTFKYKPDKVILTLFNILMCSHLEFGIHTIKRILISWREY